MAGTITYLATDLVAQVRTDSDLVLSQVYTDAQLATVISDAGSDLRDVFTATNQKYDISTFDFSLVGGIGLNSINLPLDFQQGHSIDVNPATSTPFTLRYLPNWLNRNSCSMPFQVFGNNFGPKAYTFLGSEILVLPAINAGGLYRLYYTPTWTPLALPTSIDVETASIPIVPASTFGFGTGNQFILDAGPDTFFATDVGNSLAVLGAVNSDNNGVKPIATFLTARDVVVTGTTTSETFSGGATVSILRQSRVDNAGNWTFYGDNPFNNATIAVNVGDVITVKGTPSNDGTYVVTQAATGGNTVVTAGVTTVAENFPGIVTVSVQAQGTRGTLPQNMNPWIQYIKTQACITVRNKRGQPVDSFEARLAVMKDRIQTILQERQEEPTQPPQLRGRDGWGTEGGGLW